MIQLKNTHTTSVQIEYRIAAYVSALSSQHAAFLQKSCLTTLPHPHFLLQIFALRAKMHPF
jgi:hypothetical protein